MTRLSFNELKFAVRWAALGVHVPAGLADELAAAALHIASMGLNPVAVVIPALKNVPDDYVWGELEFSDENGTRILAPRNGGMLTIVEAGPALADAVALCGGAELRADNVDCPILTAGYLAASGLAGGCCLSWKAGTGHGVSVTFSKDQVSHISADDRTLLYGAGPASILAGKKPSAEQAFNIARRELDAAYVSAYEDGIEVSDGDWRDMWDLTTRAFVKSTEQSRLAGAGAGLNDAD